MQTNKKSLGDRFKETADKEAFIKTDDTLSKKKPATKRGRNATITEEMTKKSVDVPVRLDDAFKLIAPIKGDTFNSFVRDSLEEYVKKNKEVVKKAIDNL